MEIFYGILLALFFAVFTLCMGLLIGVAGKSVYRIAFNESDNITSRILNTFIPLTLFLVLLVFAGRYISKASEIYVGVLSAFVGVGG